mgnify:CR=1 FL=1
MVAADGGIRRAESLPLKVDAVGRGSSQGKAEKSVLPGLEGGRIGESDFSQQQGEQYSWKFVSDPPLVPSGDSSRNIGAETGGRRKMVVVVDEWKKINFGWTMRD